MAALNAVGGVHFASLQPALVSSSLAAFTLNRILNPEQESSSLEELAPKGTNIEQVKTAVAGLTSVLLESAKHDVTVTDFRAALQDQGVSAPEAEKVAAEYERYKPSLRRLLARTQFSLPNLTGVRWRLDQIVQSKHLLHVNEPVFMLRFNILHSNGREEPLEVTCSEEHLRELHTTLSQATHQVSDTLKKLS
mmetsp:Transcript_42173/g.98926  ORF Transcript_42173/g.98926 Transcript_42173/m.98926 type:complete len:193 (-) Transcript_42173:96-674(-)